MNARARSAFFLLAVICLLLGPAASLHAGDQDTSTVSGLIRQGDDYSEKQFNNEKALKAFQEAFAHAPNSYDILWRLSRTYVDIGEHQPAKTDAEKQEQLKTYEKALDFAEKAVLSNPNGSMGYTRRAIARGRIALFRGIWESIDMVKQTRTDCEKAIALDPNSAPAHYVLGRTHAKVCEKPRIVRWPLGLGWANMDESIANYEKAIALRPDFIMYRLDCARAYVEMDEYEKARAHLSAIPTLPKKDEDDDRFRTEAAQLMEQIKGK